MKKFFAILLVLALCMGTFPAVYAEGGQGTLQLTDEEILDRVKGGWVGQMAGVTWAAPTEFYDFGAYLRSTRI